QDAEAAGVAHGGNELRAGQVGPHRRGDDRVLDSQQVAEIGSHEYSKGYPVIVIRCWLTSGGTSLLRRVPNADSIRSAARFRPSAASMRIRSSPARTRKPGKSRTVRTAARRRLCVSCATGIDRPTPAHSTRAPTPG